MELNMLIAEFDPIYLIGLAAFGAIAVGVWVVLDWVYNRRTRTDERLEELGQNRRRDQFQPNKYARKNAVTEILGKASPSLAKSLQPKTEKEAGKLKQRLSHGGFRSAEAPTIFLALKIIGVIGGGILGGGIFLFFYGFTFTTLVRTLIFAGISFYLPDIVLWWIAKKRKEAIFLALPDALDLMVVCVEAGLGLDQAMRKVADEMATSKPVIAYEFGVCNMQLQMGRPRQEVLNELGSRSGVDDLKALASIIIQADKFGSSIAQALRVQSEAMRTRRRQIAEEKAAKTAVQLIFPLVLFIFPGIFVVLVGPAAITMVNEMLPMMSGAR